jgi:Ca2+-binding EF-hand superfamily protein
MKAFKYFDLNDNGVVEPDEFAKAIEKIGIQIPTKQVCILSILKNFVIPENNLDGLLIHHIFRNSLTLNFYLFRI